MKISGSSLSAVLGIAIFLGSVLFVVFLMNGTKQESEVLIYENTVEIKGQFGTVIDTDDITDVRLVDTIPAVSYKVNGAGLGEIKKGDFKVEGLGTCKLYIHSGSGPFIMLSLKNQYIIINFVDLNKTESLYGDLKAVLQR